MIGCDKFSTLDSNFSATIKHYYETDKEYFKAITLIKMSDKTIRDFSSYS